MALCLENQHYKSLQEARVKYVLLSKMELWKKMQKHVFSELFKSKPEKARRLFNDLWDSMTPDPSSKKKWLFEDNYLRWQYEVEGEIK